MLKDIFKSVCFRVTAGITTLIGYGFFSVHKNSKIIEKIDSGASITSRDQKTIMLTKLK